MEFKGTKGDWIVQCIDLYDYKSLSIGSQSENTVIALCYIPNKEIEQEQKANAKLISKAPEMLEMLKDVLTTAQSGNMVEAYKIEELINSATEL